MVERHIETRQFRDRYGNLRADDQNNILHKAILLYIHDTKKRDWLNGTPKADIKLLDPETADSDDSDSEDEDHSMSYLARQLRALKLTSMPLEDTLVEIEQGLYFSTTTSNENPDKGNGIAAASSGGSDFSFKTSSTTITISCTTQNAPRRIDDFIQEAFDYYQRQAASKSSNKRYMLTLAATPRSLSSEDKKPATMTYVKYGLSDEKTFESLFLPRKTELLDLLNDFTDKKGKFAIKGFPQKLGLLLHGPPGTGKTSLIKAIAHYTNRHIVAISLKRVRTNQQLMELMYGCEFACQGEDLPMRVPFHKLIFTLEDVDAASDIVCDRRINTPSPPPTPTPTVAPNGLHPQGPLPSTTTGKGVSAEDYWLASQTVDELDLAGLLNALDGVVDCPGRIVVMTTNHPEKLDPALIRPGRINMKLHLGRLAVSEAEQMLAHYYPADGHVEPVPLDPASPPITPSERAALLRKSSRVDKRLSKEQADRLRSVFVDDVFTPAQLEEMCAECQTFDELVDKLRHSSREQGNV
eukprot:c12978_g1_i1.p1 GENE.c12978_g1_i1~~c12978_g1_i1.p1  ORF type:complete len:597 (+),score=129.17 c12978_g1_i1:219-1793(+)